MIDFLKRTVISAMAKSPLEKELSLYFYGNNDLDHDGEGHLSNIVERIIASSSNEAEMDRAVTLIRRRVSLVHTWQNGLKSLHLLQILLTELPALFSKVLIACRFDNLQNMRGDSTYSKDWLHSMIVPLYYNYLRKKALTQAEAGFSLLLDETTTIKDVHLLFKLVNLLGSILKIKDLFKNSFIKFKNVRASKLVAPAILEDCILMYNTLSSFVQKYVSYIFDEERTIALQVYELYVEVVRITPEMQSFAGLAIHFGRSKNIKLDTYKVDINMNKRLEQYVQTLKKGVLEKSSATTIISIRSVSKVEKPTLRVRLGDDDIESQPDFMLNVPLHEQFRPKVSRPSSALLPRGQRDIENLNNMTLEEEKRETSLERGQVPRLFPREYEQLYYESIPNSINSPSCISPKRAFAQ